MAKKRILVIEDDKDINELIQYNLDKEGFLVASTYSSEQAFDYLKNQNPELIILDLMLPGIDGLEVLRKVKETRPEIEVIVLTGHGNEEDRKLCMELGAFAYLQKPLDINVLSVTIQQANEKLRQKKGSKD